jgi:signal transduction histidine kinase
VLIVAYPVLDANALLKSVLFLGIDLTWLADVLALADVPDKSNLTVIDRDGTILARYPNNRKWTGQSVAETWIAKTVFAQQEGVAEGMELGEEQHLFAFSTAAGGKIGVWASIPHEVAFAEVTRIFRHYLAGAGIVTLLALSAAWMIGYHSILRPVNALITTTEQLSAGDLSARTKLFSGKGELGRLAAAFDRMANSLERRYTELQTLRDIDLSILSTLDLRSSLEILLDKIEQYLPYSAATVTILNTATGLLEPVAWRHIEVPRQGTDKTRPFKTLPHLVFEYKGPLTISDISSTKTDDRDSLLQQGFNSYLGIPLAAKNEPIGVISFYGKKKHLFNRGEIDFLTTLAGQASIAINNSVLYDRVRQQAMDLAASNKVKDEFLGVMSHELRTPLNVIRGYAEIVKDGTLGAISLAQTEALSKITNGTAGLLAMINEILVTTAIESRSIQAELRPTHLGELLDNLKSNYAVFLDKKDLKIRWNYPADLPVIETDGTKLNQILHNLIGNAIKFTENGSVTISVRYRSEVNTVEMKVADTGIGIPEELHEAIFEKFRQADSSHIRDYEGVGLGLYIAKQFTKLLHGDIVIQSEVGKGSTFIVTVPAEVVLPCAARIEDLQSRRQDE